MQQVLKDVKIKKIIKKLRIIKPFYYLELEFKPGTNPMNKIILAFTFFLTAYQSLVTGQICPNTPGTELVTNGNFESGNTGFTNDFGTPCPGPCTLLPGDSWINTSNPGPHNSGGYFKNMQDHTPGAGTNMLVFDFNANSPNDDIYRTTVTVQAGKTYFFSSWFANIAINNTTPCPTCPGGVYITNSPQLRFKITGGPGNPTVTSPTVKVDSLSNDWNQYFTTYTASVGGTVTIEIENLRGGNQSNDLAIDDISFTDGCDKITNLATLGQSAVLPDQLSICNVAFPYTLNPALPGSYGHTWKSQAGATLGTATTYNVPATPAANSKVYLCYTYIPGCPRMDSVVFTPGNINVDLGSDVSMCAPINYTLQSGVSVPPATITWSRNGVLIPGANSTSYTATQAGTYRVDVARTGCGSDFDELTISSPTSTLSGTGTYCNTTSPTQANFSVTGSTKIKWYRNLADVSALNSGNELPTISLSPHTAANTTTPGCAVGLYAEDISSYPGTLRPGTTAHTTSCPAGSATQFSGIASSFVEINQPLTLSSVDFQVLSGWSNPSTYTFSIRSNNPTGGPYCGTCSPAGNYNGPTAGAAGLLYSKTSASIATTPSHVETLPVSYTLAPGRYWFEITSSGGAFASFDCTPTNAAGTDLWANPVTDNTGNNAIRQLSALKGGNPGSAGGLFNMQFQVGSNNACDRLFICATLSCPAPVEFFSFDVKKHSGSNYLIWKTASEDNSASFVVERSSDGIHFESLAQIPAAGHSTNLLTYSHTDHNVPSSSILYYRIKEVDIDGSAMYSQIKSINNEEQSVAIYPVPVKQGQGLNLEFTNEEEEMVVVEICNNLGQSLSKTEHHVRSGLNTLEVNTSQIIQGSYYVRVTGSRVRIAKFLIE